MFQTLHSTPVQGCNRCDGLSACRSYTFSEGSRESGNNPKTYARSESVGEECYSEPVENNRKSSASVDSVTWTKNSSKSIKPKERNSVDVSDIDILSEPSSGGRHLRQHSDSMVDSAKGVKDFHEPVSNESEARDAITRLEPRGPFFGFHRSSAPFRSASFGQADFNQGTTLKQLFLTKFKLILLLTLINTTTFTYASLKV